MESRPNSTSSACIELGFIEKVDPWKLKSKFFPSKVGGFPSWLSLEMLPQGEDMQCKNCQKPLIFLCQIYAPISEKECCFHRSVFVFICRDGQCNLENDSSNFKVFRCQLFRKNKYYSFDPPKEEEKDSDNPNAAKYTKLCRICGAFGPKMCAGCKLVTYCSREHQGLDWKAGHKWECKNKEIVKDSIATKSLLFPEYDIDMEPEEIEAQEEKTEEEVWAEYEKILKKGQSSKTEDDAEYDEKDLLKMAARETDKQFALFRSRIDPYPDQIIRYDRKGKPLLVSAENKPAGIPPCPHCGEERIFEFQIMPQLLVHLKVDSTGPSIDWGTILIYTCPYSCTVEGRMYVEEIAFKQDYSPSADFLKQ